MQERYRTVWGKFKSIAFFYILSTKFFPNKFCFGIWSHIFSLPLCFCLFSFMSISVKKYNILYIHINELKIMYLHMPIQNSLWHARIGIFNLNKIYIQKIKVPRLPLTNCHFSVLFFQFLFFFIKLFFRLTLRKLLLLVHYILGM